MIVISALLICLAHNWGTASGRKPAETPAATPIQAAFSPTDVSAIKPWAKLLMITEPVVSLGIAGLVIARAINILA